MSDQIKVVAFVTMRPGREATIKEAARAPITEGGIEIMRLTGIA